MHLSLKDACADGEALSSQEWGSKGTILVRQKPTERDPEQCSLGTNSMEEGHKVRPEVTADACHAGITHMPSSSALQENIRCPSSLSVVKDRSLPENQEEGEEVFDPPIDLSSDEEYYVEESRSAKFKKSGKEHIDHIKKAFSKENMQKTRQNFDKKVSGIRTRIVTPERRERLRQSGERLRQSGERLRQSGERFKKSISNAAPSKEAFKIRSLRKPKDPKAEGQEGDRGMGVDIIAGSLALGPIHEFHPDEFSETEKEVAKVGCIPQEGGGPPPPEPLKVTFKPQVRVEDDESLLLDLKPSS